MNALKCWFGARRGCILRAPMTSIYLAASLTALALLPIFTLLLRAFGPRWFTGPVAICVVALIGWILVNLSIYFSFEDACETMATYGNNPPQNIADSCTSDGAARVFGVLLGGLYALIYYAPFALVYEIARFARRVLIKRRDNELLLNNRVK